MTLKLYGRDVSSVFSLLGPKERGLTASLGFTLAKDQKLRAAVLSALGVAADTPDVSLESYGDGLDRTDIELADERVRVVIEAKVGWQIPDRVQLEKYADRRPDVILAITHCTDLVARKLGLPTSVRDVPVVHWPWRRMLEIVRAEQRRGGRWIKDLQVYLEANVATLQNISSAWVYCVVLGPIQSLGGAHGRDYLERDLYFHPQGEGYPKTPPNYLGFRWANMLQTVRHVDSYEILGDLRDSDAIGSATVTDEEAMARPHLVYRLGPHIGPVQPLPAGTNYRASRHWAFLDLLLTAPTIKDALAHTRARQKDAGEAVE